MPTPTENLSLFAEPDDSLRTRLRERLSALAKRQVFIGTSSWKYEGWMDQIYSRDRYLVRGKFSKQRFEAECLSEYAQTFPIVCGDFSFYQFPSAEFWRRLFRSAPPALRYAFKVPEEVTVKMYPVHSRYGDRAGGINEQFLNAELFRAMFLDLLEPYREQVAVLIFEFGRTQQTLTEFLSELDPFVASLPAGYRYAVEIRNQEFLAQEYFSCLRQHGVAHVFNAWTRMPEIAEQMQLPDVYTADFTVTRALLRKGRPYEQAVSQFTPYREIRDPNPGTRQALRDLIGRAARLPQPSYIFVNNRLEGNAPGTIEAIT
ncbi:MAG TPA: DUF72 domain-containing protein [Bryobacteraceae bacterium]|nr:DUF72 domain-containing protein [Bryobacteraceae bacterium]